MKLLELKIRWTKPDFDHEWDTEVKDHPGYAKIFPDKATWLKAAKRGRKVQLSSGGVEALDNAASSKSDWENLSPEKKARVLELFRKGSVELPVVVRYKMKLRLVGGNTRLNYAKNHGEKLIVWLIDVDALNEELVPVFSGWNKNPTEADIKKLAASYSKRREGDL